MKNLIEKLSNMPPLYYVMVFGAFTTIVGGLLCDYTKATFTGVVLIVLGLIVSCASAVAQTSDRQY